jgi:2,4'-dihydroxyacetophenone dioxygenase
MYGVNLNLDADGNVESVSDGSSSLVAYEALCEAQDRSPESFWIRPN